MRSPATSGLASGAAGPVTSDAARLTRRDREIVALISQGLTNREIATLLCITETTAGHHV